MAIELPLVDGGAEAAKRSAEAAAAGEPPAKAVKVEVKEDEVKAEVKEELKAEIKEELKAEVKKEEHKDKDKKEKKHKEGKEDKDKKDKKEKHKDKDKDKKEKKEHKPDKENEVVRQEEHYPSASPDTAVDKELDQRKLFKDGQKFMTPPVADATRGFYESLYEENPDSKIAIRFVVEYGLFAVDAHKKCLKRYNHMKEKGFFDARTMVALNLAKVANKADKKEKKDGDKEKKEKKDKSEKKEKKGEDR